MKAIPIRRSAFVSRVLSLPLSCQTTTADAAISIKLSSPKPASATERAATAAARTSTLPNTFQASVAYSSRSPRRSSNRRLAGTVSRSRRVCVRASGSGEPQDQSKGPFRARPDLTDHRFAARSDEVAEDERDDDRIVELPGHWDEVRDEVEGQGEIGDEGDQQQLATPRHAGIACEARHEHDAVGDERGKCACVLVAAADHEPGEE